MNSSQETPSPREPSAGEPGTPASSNRIGRRWRNLSRENRIGAGLIGAWAIVVAAVMTQAPGGTPSADVSASPGVNAATRADSPFSLRDGGQTSVTVSGSPSTSTGIKDGGTVAASAPGEAGPAQSAAVPPPLAPPAPAAPARSGPQTSTPKPAPPASAAPPAPAAPVPQTSTPKPAPAPVPVPVPVPQPAAPVAPVRTPTPTSKPAPASTPTSKPAPASTPTSKPAPVGTPTTQPSRTSAPSTSTQGSGNSRVNRERDSGSSRWNNNYGDRGSNRDNQRGNSSAWSRDGWGR